MATWAVAIPITGRACTEVEAETEAEAISKAIDEITIDDIEEWNAHEKVVEGNVCYAMLNEAYAENLDDEE